MIVLNGSENIYLYSKAVDMRKAIDGLIILVIEGLNMKPQSGDIYIFRNRDCKKVKILYWDKNGFIMHYKRLERGKFKMPTSLIDGGLCLSSDQFSWLLAGLDFIFMNEYNGLNYENYF